MGEVFGLNGTALVLALSIGDPRNIDRSRCCGLPHSSSPRWKSTSACQKLIEKSLHSDFPQAALLGRSVAGNPDAEYRWVRGPNRWHRQFHLRHPARLRLPSPSRAKPMVAERRLQAAAAPATRLPTFSPTVTNPGRVVYDPFCNEMWTAIHGHPARLNGKIIHVSQRRKLAEAIVSIGFAKTREHSSSPCPTSTNSSTASAKCAIMGAAALAMTYVASGRFDAYVERGIRLWDIAAGGLILECAGGEFCASQSRRTRLPHHRQQRPPPPPIESAELSGSFGQGNVLGPARLAAYFRRPGRMSELVDTVPDTKTSK